MSHARPFRLALENIKPMDAMAVGMYTQFQPDQIRQNVRTVTKLLSEPALADLQDSKDIIGKAQQNEQDYGARSHGYAGSRRGLRCDGAR